MKYLAITLSALVLLFASNADAGNCNAGGFNSARGFNQNFHAQNFNFNRNFNVQQEFVVRRFTQRDGDVIGVTNFGREVFLGNVGVRRNFRGNARGNVGNFAGSFLGAFAGQAAFGRRDVVIINGRRRFIGF